MTEGPLPSNSTEFGEWLSFDTDSGETLLIDSTFLTSNWSCVYGTGCPGIEEQPAPELERGCCAFGAHFTDASDRDRVLARAKLLTSEQWQHQSVATDAGPLDTDEDGADVTRLVDGACIFLNRPDFGRGAGCALHVAATEAGDVPLEWKPDVCWQLPIRVEEHQDENGHTTRTLRSWLRRDWGSGGTDLGWWCTETDGAFEGHEPVYVTLAAELEVLVGQKSYECLASRLEEECGP